MKKAFLGFSLIFLIAATLLFSAFTIKLVKAEGTIYIRADGSIDPSGAPISSVDQIVYVFEENILDSIVVERDGIVIDGSNHWLTGPLDFSARTGLRIKNVKSTGNGIMFGAYSSNITIESSEFQGAVTADGTIGVYFSSNVTIESNILSGADTGVDVWNSDHVLISENNITANNAGIYLHGSSYANTISTNFFSENSFGILSQETSGNRIVYNQFLLNNRGISFWNSPNTYVRMNNFTQNNIGIDISESSDSLLSQNNFIQNTQQIQSSGSSNSWDDGYPSGGNYWSDYSDVDQYSGPNQDQLGSDGIGDVPYVIDSNNVDHYPMMSMINLTMSNNPPDKPSTPEPTDGSSQTPPSVMLSVYVSDPDGDAMNISFYDSATTILIGNVINVPSRSRASIQWLELNFSTSYGWYTVADDGRGGSTQSDAWTFNTRGPPRTIVVPDDYTTIQEAVDNANLGDTVYVRAGTYNENVSLKSNLAVIGEGKYSTVLNGGFYLGGIANTMIDNFSIVGGGTFPPVYWGGTMGICLDAASFNIITNNIIMGCSDAIMFYENLAENNTIAGNDIFGNARGLSFCTTYTWNRIFHNNFNNSVNIFSNADMEEIWDDGYPSGGNCWSDYSGVDLFSGPNQDQSGSDGIGDTPYVIDVNNVDHYPLLNPNTPANHSPNKPVDPVPANGYNGTALAVTLSVGVSDADGDSMTVSFYDAVALTLLGTDYDVANGNTASIQWSGLSYSTTYSWYVVADDGKGGTTQSDAWSFITQAVPRTIVVPNDYPTIQAAINAATVDDTILVLPGIYYENINLKDGVRVQGAGADVTTINGNGAGSVVTAVGVGSGTLLVGFTITNGYVYDGFGGGIDIEGSSVVVANNVITANGADAGGGGIWIIGGSPTITGNIISQNGGRWAGDNAVVGGGIGVHGGSPTIDNNVIIQNRAWYGSGIDYQSGGSGQLANNVIMDNTGTVSNRGGGIEVFHYSTPNIINNIIVGNSGKGINVLLWSSPSIDFNDIWSNAEGSGSTGPSDISIDPAFVNPAIGDYHLKVGSPCIDAGTNVGAPTCDLDGNPRPIDGNGDSIAVTDMGAYEFARSTPPTYSATIRAYCNTEKVDLTVGVTLDYSTTTVYKTPYTFTGLSGMHAFTVSSLDQSNHPFMQWDIGALTQTINIGSGGTFTALYEGSKKPVAVLTVENDFPNIGSDTWFYGINSYNPDGGSIHSFSYFFDFGDGKNSGWVEYPTVGAIHDYTFPGTFWASLKVINRANGLESDWTSPHTITVLAPPGYPNAMLNVSPEKASVNAPIKFDASASTDSDGGITDYCFDFGDGSPLYYTTNSIVNHAYAQQGEYCAGVTVYNKNGLESASEKVKVIVPFCFTHWTSFDHPPWTVEKRVVSDPDPKITDSDLVLHLPKDAQSGNAKTGFFQKVCYSQTALSYGRFIVRFKMSPYVEGLLGSFFLYNAPPNGDGTLAHQEIDVEWYGSEASDRVHCAFWQNGGQGRDKNGDPIGPTWEIPCVFPAGARNLDDGNYHICEINYLPHEVKITIDGNVMVDWPITIASPLYFYTGQAWARFASPNAGYDLSIDSTEIWQDNSAFQNGLSATAMSPVNLFLTDPLNRSIGTDPDTGQFVNQIPDAYYSGPYAEPQEIFVPEPLAGDYQLRGSGTGTGSYTLTLVSVVNGSFFDANTWQGNITTGEQTGLNLTLEPDGGIILSHNIRTADLISSKNIIGKGYSADLDFLLENRGNSSEIVNITVYVNQTIVAQFTNVTLGIGNITRLCMKWNTSDYEIGDYIVTVVADTVPSELDVHDNNCTSGLLTVSIPGDTNGDSTVDIYDAIILAGAFNTNSSSTHWNPNADINGDNIIDIYDAIILANHYNEHYP